MRLPLLPIISLIAVGLGLDAYIWRLLRKSGRRWPAVVHLILSLLFLALIVTAICLPRRSGSDDTLRIVMWMLYTYLSVYIPKLLFVIVDLAGRIPEFFHHRRIPLFRPFGVIMALGMFIIMWWGALVCRYQIDVKHVEVFVDNLPEGFEDYRIIQFSDMHVGTFGSDTAFVSAFVDSINALKPNVIVFTGDIVNRRSSELDAHVSPLSRLSAPDGVYSILGNHDYGDYSIWSSPEAKITDRTRLASIEKRMGWRLLNDAHVWLRSRGDSIALVGVENIGEAPFPTYGSLVRAYPDASDDNVKILLSHNPMHWVDSIAGQTDMNVALTLSGHTHAMQIEAGGWSPAKWRYPTWGGLYTSSTGQQLYVNIGGGTVGFPARIGATPEITVITLKRSQHK